MPKYLQSRPVLLIAFAFAVMGAPVASVAYAIEAALRTLGAHLELLLPTMALVIGIIALAITYHQLVVRPRRRRPARSVKCQRPAERMRTSYF